VKTFTIGDISAEERVVWRPNAWLKAAGYPFSRPTLYNEIHRGRIDARKVGGNTIILTSPRDYLESLPKGVGPARGRGGRFRAKASEAGSVNSRSRSNFRRRAGSGRRRAIAANRGDEKCRTGS
jgi:hypothetical protein